MPWLALAVLLICLFGITRHFWIDSVRTHGRLRMPARVKVQLQFHLPPQPQQYFLLAPQPLESAPERDPHDLFGWFLSPDCQHLRQEPTIQALTDRQCIQLMTILAAKGLPREPARHVLPWLGRAIAP